MKNKKATISEIKSKVIAFADSSVAGEDVKLPAEYTLCDMYGVSRPTIREVLAQMIQEGIVYRVRGKGAYIRRKLTSLRHDFTKLTSVTQELKSRGFTPSAKLLHRTVRQADKKIAAKLNIAEGDDYIAVERIRFADRKVAVLNKQNFRMSSIEKATVEDLSGSLFDYWATIGITISYAKTSIRASVLTQREVPELDSEVVPFIFVEEIYYNDIGEVFCYVTDYYSNEIFSFDLIRTR